MSRIGKAPIQLPSGVTVTVVKNTVTVKGAKGELSHTFPEGFSLAIEGTVVTVVLDRKNLTGGPALWGLTRALIANMVEGVSVGFKKSLQIEGVGYKFDINSPTKITLAVGYSHKITLDAPQGVVILADEKDKNVIHISGIDKQAVGYFSALVRSQKVPEPYKGKGIRYLGEKIRRKAGKTAGK